MPAPAGQAKVRVIASKVVAARCRDLTTLVMAAQSLANMGELAAARAELASISVAADELAGMLDALQSPAPAGAL